MLAWGHTGTGGKRAWHTHTVKMLRMTGSERFERHLMLLYEMNFNFSILDNI